MKKSIIVLSFLISTSCYSQNEKLLIGKWEGIRKESISGRKNMNNGKLIKELTVYEFVDNSHLIDYTFKPEVSKYTYTFKDSLLCFAKVCFKVLRLTNTELVLLDFNPKDPKNPLVFKHFYVKSKKIK